MSIKKGKKQVYKVGREVRVVECADMTREHLGIKGKIIDILEDGTYVVNGTTELCGAKRVSPLKPKKSIKKTYKKDEEIEAPKTYKYLWMCDNCRKMDYVHIPLGTTIKDFIEKGFICKFCGC